MRLCRRSLHQKTSKIGGLRIRALKIYDRHNQSNAIDFINTVVAKFPFRIREVRMDNGHEFQAQFHWHVEDLGIRHAYVKPASPQWYQRARLGQVWSAMKSAIDRRISPRPAHAWTSSAAISSVTPG